MTDRKLFMQSAKPDPLSSSGGDDDLVGDREASSAELNWVVTRNVINQASATEYRLVFTSGFSFVTDAQGADDVLYGGAGNDWLFGGIGGVNLFGNGGNDTLIGGTGADFMNGGKGDDVYEIAPGDGYDSIADDGGTVTAVINANFTDIAVRVNPATPDVLTIGFSAGNGVFIFDGLKGAIDLFQFNDGTYTLAQLLKKLPDDVNVTGTSTTANTLYGGAGDDVLNAASGNNTFQAGDGANLLNGGTGKDRYIFSRNIAQDIIIDAGGNADVIQLIDLAPEEITIQRDAHRFRLVSAETLDALTLINSYSDPNAWIETIEFDDGTVWDYNYLVSHAATRSERRTLCN